MITRVLVVDDSLTVRMDISELLQEAGFDIVACASIAEARAALAQDVFGLVVLDVMLPDGDGIDLLKEIRAAPETANIAVMVLSTESEVQDRVRGLSTGANDYIGKPYDSGYLVGRAKQLMRSAGTSALGGQKTILLIDDSRTFREELKAALEDADYHVVTANDGEEGLRLAADIRPDAAVVDGTLPGIDGPTVIRRMRLDAALRELPCFLLTGSEERGAEVQALEAGADAFARKDDNVGIVLARIAAMLRASGSRSVGGDTLSLQGPKKVLAVDDSETYLQHLGEALRSEGYEVVLARSGEEALDLLAVDPVDCILLDLMMPGIGGRETCLRIKNAPAIRDTPVVMLTAVDDREAMISGLGAGADDYIAKSSDFEVVRARVLAQIRRKRFEDEHRISREQQRAALEVQLDRLNLMGEITRAIAARYDLTSIYRTVLNSLEDQLPVDFACVLTLDAGEIGTGYGTKSEKCAQKFETFNRMEHFFGTDCESPDTYRELIYHHDILEVDYPLAQALAKEGMRSLIVSPLKENNHVFALLIAVRAAEGAFNSIDANFIRQLSEHLSLAIIQAKLQQSLQDAYDDLRQSQQIVTQQERLRAIGQMASGIAHDINNAMTPLAVMTQSLLENAESHAPEVVRYLELAKLVTDDVTATIQRMREFYREREPQVELKRVEVNPLIEQVIDLTRARWSDMAHHSGIAITVERDLAQELPPIMGIESEIREVLTNLVFNAIDAMPEGGTLTVRSRAVAGDGARGRVFIEVADTGVGMDEQTLNKCTEPFFTTKGERGTGLGLAMVHGAIKRHDARLEIDSTPGAGTTFRLDFADIDLPVSGADEATSAASPIVGLKILLADDDALILEVMQAALEKEGHVVTAAEGGAAAIQTFETAFESGNPFNVVITDLGMPNINGLDVARAVKSLSATTPTILLSGWGRKMDAEEADIDDFDFTLSKPPRLPELRATLADCARKLAAT